MGWFRVGGKKDVPRDACYVGHHGDCYVWVMPEGVGGLTRFTLLVLSIVKLTAGQGRRRGRSHVHALGLRTIAESEKRPHRPRFRRLNRLIKLGFFECFWRRSRSFASTSSERPVWSARARKSTSRETAWS